MIDKKLIASGLNIPYKVIIYLPKADYLKKADVKRIKIFPIDLDRSDKGRRSRVRRAAVCNNGLHSCFSTSWPSDDKIEQAFDEIILDNSGFSIELSEEYQWTRYSRGYETVMVKVHHPQLDSRTSYPIYILLPVSNIIQVLCAGGCEGGKIFGSYAFREQTYFSGFGGSLVVLEDPADEEYVHAKEFSKTRYESKFTTAWKPGHVYLLPDDTNIIYFGKLKESMIQPGWYWRNQSILTNSWYNSYHSSFSKNNITHCCMRLDKAQMLSGSIADALRVQISEDINGLLAKKSLYSYDRIYKYVSPKRGIDLGEYYKDLGDDISIIISECCIDGLPKPDNDTAFTNEHLYLVPGILNKHKVGEVRQSIMKIFQRCIANTLYTKNNSSYGYKVETTDPMTVYNIMNTKGDIAYVKLFLPDITNNELEDLMKIAINLWKSKK